MSQDILILNGVVKRFGKLVALDHLDFAVREGEILGIAGPNGAGKSTALAVCTGQLAPDAGSITFRGQTLTGRQPHEFCHAGIARTFQIPQVFSSMTVRENIEVGLEFGWHGKPRGSERSLDTVLALTGLETNQMQSAASVDLITRKQIMLAAALATDPKVLFMDEPLAGLNEAEIEIFADLIQRVNAELGIAIVLVEHKVRTLARLSSRIMILNFGQIVRLDVPDVIMSDPEIIELYLGKSHAA
ncbi:MAG: branched-chain amino acid transport system ATP-binding protein [Rhodobacteraceae bacterium HLUCCA12]|nr:MAG: branched-chain amino acid transport system ATP-binding protein [Rhodobacteraceae bacterium HLUCCA12]